MIKKPILLTLATSLLCFSGCAAKNRWFSRKDYSEMQDPFMESEALASREDKESGRSSGETAGRATLNGPSSGSDSANAGPSTARVANPKSILQTGVSEDGVSRTGSVSNASYPEKSAELAGATAGEKSGVRSYQGPALSDFLNGKKSEAAAAASSAAGTASTATRSALGKPATAASRAVSPAARAAALPDITEDAAGFNNFLQEKTTAVGAKAQQATDAVSSKAQQATNTVKQSEESVNDFADWAAQEQQRWSQKGSETAAAVSSMPAAASQQLKSTAKQARKIADDAVMDFNNPQFEQEAAAQPLMKRSAPPADEFAADFEEVQEPAQTVEDNPFSNPFEADNAKPVPAAARKPTAGTSAKKAIDSSFEMDSGWKPSHLERP